MLSTVEIQREKNSLLNGLIAIAAFGIIIWCLIEAKEFFIPLLFSVLLAMLMAPITRLLKRAKVPEGPAVALTTLVLYLPLIGLASLVLVEAESIVRHWPEIFASAKTYANQFSHSALFTKFQLGNYLSADDLQSKISERAGAGALLFFTGLTAILSAGTTTLLVMTFAAVMLASRIQLRHAFEGILSYNGSTATAKTMDGALAIIEKFLVARVLIIVIVAAADFVVLKAFGVSYAIMLAAVLGISTLIPIVGFFIGIIPPVIVAASLGHSAISVGALFACLWIVSSAQDHILTPKLIGKKLNLNFLATYIAIFAGEQMWGLWGMFLSIPMLGMLRVVLTASDAFRPWARLLEEEGAPTEQIAKAVKSEAGTTGSRDDFKSEPLPIR